MGFDVENEGWVAWAAAHGISQFHCKIHLPVEYKQKGFPGPHHLYHPPIQSWEKDRLFWQSCLSNESYLWSSWFSELHLKESSTEHWDTQNVFSVTECEVQVQSRPCRVICNIKAHWYHLEGQLECPSYAGHGEKKPESCSFSSDTLTRQTHAPLKITQLCSDMFPSHVPDLKICLSSECYAY